MERLPESLLKKKEKAVVTLVGQMSDDSGKLKELVKDLNASLEPTRKEVFSTARKALHITAGQNSDARNQLIDWLKVNEAINEDRYNSHLYSASDNSPMNVPFVSPDIF